MVECKINYDHDWMANKGKTTTGLGRRQAQFRAMRRARGGQFAVKSANENTKMDQTD